VNLFNNKGIGGLATALALQQEGIRCTVYERDRVFEDRKQGYGLTLSNTPKGGLAKLGILEACIRQDCNSNSHWVFTPEVKAEILVRINNMQNLEFDSLLFAQYHRGS